jgi:hypothetical protein
VKRYAFHVMRKNGEVQTELRVHYGAPPPEGTEVKVVLDRKMIRARVGTVHLDPGERGGDAVVVVHADEID